MEFIHTSLLFYYSLFLFEFIRKERVIFVKVTTDVVVVVIIIIIIIIIYLDFFFMNK